MLKINWRVRFKNKAFLVGFFGVVLGFVYQMLGLFDVVASVSQEQVIQILGIVINLLVGLGVVVDPTTKGVNDSERAMGYR